MRSMGSIIDVKDGSLTRSLRERPGVRVVVLDYDVPADSITNGGGAANLQVEEVLRLRAADRPRVVGYAGEYHRGRAAIHCAGARHQVVANGRGRVAEIRGRTGVIQR